MPEETLQPCVGGCGSGTHKSNGVELRANILRDPTVPIMHSSRRSLDVSASVSRKGRDSLKNRAVGKGKINLDDSLNAEQGRVLMSTRHSSYQEVTKCDDTELPVVHEVHGISNAIRSV